MRKMTILITILWEFCDVITHKGALQITAMPRWSLPAKYKMPTPISASPSALQVIGGMSL